jgi:hypothetical protein
MTDELAAAMRLDKKSQLGAIHCALPVATGSSRAGGGGPLDPRSARDVLRDAVQRASREAEFV